MDSKQHCEVATVDPVTQGFTWFIRVMGIMAAGAFLMAIHAGLSTPTGF